MGARTQTQRWRDRAKGLPSYRMVRFADDFVVLVRGTEAQAHALKKQTAEFMREQMRLTLSPEKTHVTHVDDGFTCSGSGSFGRPGEEASASPTHSQASEHCARSCTESRR